MQGCQEDMQHLLGWPRSLALTLQNSLPLCLSFLLLGLQPLALLLLLGCCLLLLSCPGLSPGLDSLSLLLPVSACASARCVACCCHKQAAKDTCL